MPHARARALALTYGNGARTGRLARKPAGGPYRTVFSIRAKTKVWQQMLELNDPLWRKLDDAYQDRDVPEALARLASAWDNEEAATLFWDSLCHQDTNYGATYAAVPHLLKIAAPEPARPQRLEIAVFLATVTLCAFPHRCGSLEERGAAPLRGLPLSLEEWDKKLAYYRSLNAVLEAQEGAASGEEAGELDHCHAVLEAGTVDAADLEKIRAIRQDFIGALPAIGALCERALLENPQEEDAHPYLLSGIATACGLHDLASVLKCSEEGWFSCSSCDCGYEYILFGDRVAIYANPEERGNADKAALDYKDGAPSRADGFMMPVEPGAAIADPRAAALLALAGRAANPKAALLTRAFLGRFRCAKCGAEASIAAGR